MSIEYNNGWFYYPSTPFPQGTLTPATDTRTPTLLADLLPVFKAHARISVTADDALCSIYLNSALSRMEQWTMLPMVPKAYDWTAPDPMPPEGWLFLPLRNCVLAGDQFGFELLASAKRIDTPASFPILLEVGFASGDDMPDDLKLSCFELALALYELRSNPEMVNVYANDVMAGNLARYWVPRC